MISSALSHILILGRHAGFQKWSLHQLESHVLRFWFCFRIISALLAELWPPCKEQVAWWYSRENILIAWLDRDLRPSGHCLISLPLRRRPTTHSIDLATAMKPYIAAPAILALIYRAWSHKSLTLGGIITAAVTAVAHASHPWSLPFALLAIFFLVGTRATKVGGAPEAPA